MDVRLRKMDSQEFEIFRENSVRDYAKDLEKEQEAALEKAFMQARKEFEQMLPEGIDTKDHFLMMIEDVRTGQAVGVIWYLYEVTEGRKQVFLNDLLIYEPARRKGYAMDALDKMVQNARHDGCAESVAYVWKHNPPGISLYQKCGYAAFKELDDGMYMKKAI